MNVLAQRLGTPHGTIQGEAKTGYENPKGLGEFECENCHFYRPSEQSCGHEMMVKYSKQPMLPSGRRKVEPEGCCEFVKRLGKKDED